MDFEKGFSELKTEIIDILLKGKREDKDYWEIYKKFEAFTSNYKCENNGEVSKLFAKIVSCQKNEYESSKIKEQPKDLIFKRNIYEDKKSTFYGEFSHLQDDVINVLLKNNRTEEDYWGLYNKFEIFTSRYECLPDSEVAVLFAKVSECQRKEFEDSKKLKQQVVEAVEKQ